LTSFGTFKRSTWHFARLVAEGQAKLQALVNSLAANAEHPDWPHVFDYLRLTRNYPASALDLLQHLVHVAAHNDNRFGPQTWQISAHNQCKEKAL
jgi:hypothetical protein